METGDVGNNVNYSLKCPGVKRLMNEAMELRQPADMYFAQPLDENLFEWHFTIRGPAETDFEGGIYHGRILFPAEYPMKPPSVIFLTPNGRFQLNQKICLSISEYHPESWQPSWSIRTALLALIGFMPSHPVGAVGSLDYPPVERKKLALQSRDWVCKKCELCMRDIFPDKSSIIISQKVSEDSSGTASQNFAKNAEASANNLVSLSADINPLNISEENTSEIKASDSVDNSIAVLDKDTVEYETNIRQRFTVQSVSFSENDLPSTPSVGSNPRSSSWDRCFFVLIFIFLILLVRRFSVYI